MIRSLSVSGYRSVKNLSLDLGPLNVLTGPNGCGKSNLYRAVYLLHAAATGNFARVLADEGSMPSVLWAGARRSGPVRLTLSVTFADGFAWEMVCGLAEPNYLPTRFFQLDPVIKEETIRFDGSVLVNRGHSGVTLHDDSGKRVNFTDSLIRSESVLSQISDPRRFPYLSALRDHVARWRFYHQFRTDEHSPIRKPQVGVFTPVLSHDGHDLGAALATILELGDSSGLLDSVKRALNGAQLSVDVDETARFFVRLKTPGLLRPLDTAELSDGTLRFLCLAAALASPRLPPLLALNEPETSLHPDLLPALAKSIADASRNCQLWVVTHSRALADALEIQSGTLPTTLRLVNGETRVA